MQTRSIALFAAGASAAALAAPAVSAGPRHLSADVYDISLTGSQVSVVTRSGTSTDDRGCTVRHADRDRRTITFASRRRAELAVSSRLPLIRFDAGARVTGSFHRETRSTGGGENCVSAPSTRNRACGPASLPARFALRPGNKLRVHFVGGFVRTRDRTRCATTLARPDRFIIPTENRLKRSPAGAVRIVLHGNFVQRTTLEHVTTITTVDWRLLLTRVT